MARTTNSTGLRLGYTAPWLFNSIRSKYSLYEDFALEYVSIFLERRFNENEENVSFVLGSLSLTSQPSHNVILVDVYVSNSRVYRHLPRRARLQRSYFRYIQFLLSLGLDRIFNVPTKVVFSLLPLSCIDANFILNYFKLRVMQRVAVLHSVSTLHRLLRSVPGLVGYRIDVTGRFARQQRATCLSVRRGPTHLSTLSTEVQYTEHFLVMKHGKCGFKVWFNKPFVFAKRSLVCQ